VGLGGRLDATNVVEQPALTVITPVSIDHQQFLGETLADIAAEKAGILKRGVTCVVGPQQDEALDVIEAKAARVGAPLLVHGQHWHVSHEHGRLIFQDETGLCDLPAPALLGPHQFQNAGTALAALRYLNKGDQAYEAAMTQAEWPARMQRLRQGPLVEAAKGSELWLDGGHNPAAGEAIAATLGDQSERSVVLICGMLNTKDVEGYLRPLSRVARHLYSVSIPGEKNTLDAAETQAIAIRAGLPAAASESVEDAIAAALDRFSGCRILICGSLYLAGAILRENS